MTRGRGRRRPLTAEEHRSIAKRYAVRLEINAAITARPTPTRSGTSRVALLASVPDRGP